MIRKAIFPGCYMQGKGILADFGGIEEIEKKRVFILATPTAVKKIIPENLP